MFGFLRKKEEGMNRRSSRLLRAFSPLLILVLLLAVGASAASPAIGKSVATTKLKAGNSRLSIGWSTETKTLDPAGNSQNPDIWVQVNMFDRLVRVGPDGKSIVPDLASNWTSAKNGTVYTFHLRKGIKFQDGTPITAKDVKFDLDRARQTARLWSWTLTAVKDVTAINSSTVRITLKHPWAPFLSDLSLFDTGIYPAAYYKKVGASGMATHPIGSGPYKFSQWKKGQYLLLVKDPHYWNAAAYPMKQLQYTLIPNDTSRLLQVESGALDVDNGLPFNQIASVQKTGRAQAQINPSTETQYIQFNDTLPQFADVHVRQAINHAIDRAALVKAVLFGHGTPANSFMPKGALDWNPNIPVPSFNLAMAKKLMKKSRYPNGFTMTMEVPSGDSVSNEIDVILKSELAPLGIKLNLRQEDPTTLFNNQQHQKYHISNSIWTNDIPDPDELVSFSVDYKLGGHSFYTWYKSTTLTHLSEMAEQTNNAAQRKADYYKIQKIFMQQVPFLPLFYVPFVNAAASNVHHFSENPLGYFNVQGVTK
jgi:peptide/nickel transport system substrate-binding protein